MTYVGPMSWMVERLQALNGQAMNGVALSRKIILQDLPNCDEKMCASSLQRTNKRNHLRRTTEPNMPNKETILVVDDEIGRCESLRMILKPLYEVHTAPAREEALHFIHDNHVDLVLLDLNMPGRSGFGVLKAIKDFRPDIEVIVITGYKFSRKCQGSHSFGSRRLYTKALQCSRHIGYRGENLRGTQR